jgi:hypothetical protein
VAVCKWGRPSENEFFAVLAALQPGRVRLEGLPREDPVDAALRACAPKGRVAPVFLHKALWAEMTQVGAARAIAVSGVDRAGLDSAWAKAPGAHACLHNRLGPTFGQMTPACADDAEAEIARPLNIENARLRVQASIYYIAKAEGEWAEILIANSPF